MKKEYAEFYGRFAEDIETNEQKVLCELKNIIDGISTDPERSPAEHILSRIKAPDSLLDKLRREGVSEDIDTAAEKLSDIVGVRVVTHFVGDVYAIADKIKQKNCWEIIKTKDYIANPKPNGYRSLHIIVKPSGSEIRTEIQLRTIAMDCWASLEHQMKYKKDIGGSTELIVSELKRCADEIASTDISMQTLRELIEKQTG